MWHIWYRFRVGTDAVLMELIDNPFDDINLLFYFAQLSVVPANVFRVSCENQLLLNLSNIKSSESITGIRPMTNYKNIELLVIRLLYELDLDVFACSPYYRYTMPRIVGSLHTYCVMRILVME